MALILSYQRQMILIRRIGVRLQEAARILFHKFQEAVAPTLTKTRIPQLQIVAMQMLIKERTIQRWMSF